MMDKECDEPFADGIEIENFEDFKIKSKTDFPGGRLSSVCVVCENIDEKVGIEIDIDQQPCAVSNNCPAAGGDCAGFLDHIVDPKKIEFKFVSETAP